ncbi:arylesterase [Reinekea sp.]|jgi:acyl-CoA thioesterase-1|uniref:arylesterase n=1 Tax=Reinekea sp. TaxID=1970455 RepID=UPI00398A4174
MKKAIQYRVVKQNNLFIALVCSFLLILFSPISHANTLLVHGDSLSAGYGMSPDRSWVTLLANKLGDDYKVVNSSISGETSKGGLDRLPGLLNEHQPDMVLIELGANDGLRGYPINQTTANLQKMINLAQAQGARVVLLGIRLPPNFGNRYTEPFFNQYATLAEKNNTGYLPFLLEGVAGFESLMQSDGLHPTAEAQPLILDNVLPFITK